MKTNFNKLTVPLFRKKDTNKSDYGHILIIAGSKNMTGAGLLSVKSALSSGAGLVTLSIPQNLYNAVIPRLALESLTLCLPSTKEGTFSESGSKEILKYISERKITAVAIGPGLSKNSQTFFLVRKLLISKINLPVVLDADGLNAVHGNLGIFSQTKIPLVITPHQGEFSRLTGLSIKEITKNRVKIVKDFAKKYNLIVVLKGHRTVVTDGKVIYINNTGNPGMAVGGSGDVLTGIIASFLGQMNKRQNKNSIEIEYVISAVRIHGIAGDIAAKEKTQISMLATDIIEKIPQAIRK